MRVETEPDTAPRTVALPADFNKALAVNRSARAGFEKLAPPHKREYLMWIEEAKKAETRAARIEKCIVMLVAGQRAKS